MEQNLRLALILLTIMLSALPVISGVMGALMTQLTNRWRTFFTGWVVWTIFAFGISCLTLVVNYPHLPPDWNLINLLVIVTLEAVLGFAIGAWLTGEVPKIKKGGLVPKT